MWSAAERFSVQAIQFILTIILARLILPKDYGLIAMLSIFLQVAQSFVDSGFSNALIQKQNRSEIDFSTVFYFNCFISIIVYSLLYFCAPYIAKFYDEPILTSICRWMGLIIVIQAISIVQISKLTISLDFKSQAKSSLISVVISGCIGVYFAYKGYGVWSLVIQSLLNSILNSTLLIIIAKWMPKLQFSLQSLKTMFGFGSKLLLSGLLHTVYTNLYSLVIGKRYNVNDVGYYNQANQISRFPSVSLMAIITRALYPIQCKMQDDDYNLRNSFIRYIRVCSMVVFVIMIGIASLSVPIVNLVLTEKWSKICPLLSILCIGYMFTSITVLNNQILNVKGRTDLYLKVEIIKKIFGLIILLSTIPFGLKIICLGIVAYNIIEMTIVMNYSKLVINITIKEQLLSFLPILLVVLIAGLCSYSVTLVIGNYFYKLILGSLTYILILIVMSSLFKLNEIKIIKMAIKNLRL